MRHGYTIEEMCAIADAHGCSYGVVQQHLEAGAPIPPKLHEIRWPAGSEHAAKADQTADDNQIAKRSKFDSYSGRHAKCDHCGVMFQHIQRSAIFIHTVDCDHRRGRKYAVLCPDCSAGLMPFGADQGKYSINAATADGQKFDRRFFALCAGCGKIHRKTDGIQTYIARPGNIFPQISRYHCRACAPGWKAELKKISTAGSPNDADTDVNEAQS